VLVADTETKTTLPAVSPDGKRVAVARLGGKPKDSHGDQRSSPDALEVIAYDLNGKELHHSPELVWKRRNSRRENDPEYGFVSLFWGPKSNENKLAVFECFNETDWLIYDLTAKRSITLKEKTFSGIGGPGILVSDGSKAESIALVDWEGKKHAITMKKGQVKKSPKETPISDNPEYGWLGNTFVGMWPDQGGWLHEVRIDTEKRAGVYDEAIKDDRPPV
jgi:hypothetical protein